MKLSKKLITTIISISASLSISATLLAAESPFITGSVISGTEQFNTDLVTRKINSLEEIEWTQISAGSQGGADSSFFHPTDPNYVYISQNMETTYRSIDGMTSVDTWQTISNEDSSGTSDSIAQIYQMEYSHQNENFGLAVNEFGMFVTHDKGKNWHPFAEDYFPHKSADNPQAIIALSAIKIDPSNDNIIYAGAGGFWLNKDARTDAKRYKTSQIGNVQGVIYKSTDKGVTWQAHSTGLPKKAEIGQIFIHPKKSNTLYVATSHGNFISTDSGLTYQPINDGLADPISKEVYVRDLAFHYDEATDLVTLVTCLLPIWVKDENGELIHTSGGIFKSLDEGKSWISLNEGLIVDYSIFRDKNGNATLQGYRNPMGKWFGVSNKEISAIVPPPDEILPSFREVEINPVNPNILYAVNCGRKENSIEPEGIWISEDGGQNWFISTRIGSGYQEDADYWNAQYSPEDVDLSTRNVSVGGEEDWSWMFTDKYPMLAYQYLAVSPDGKTLITHVFKSRIVSQDGGRTWNQVDSIEVADDVWIGRGNSNVPGKYVFAQPETNKIFFISGETGLWQLNTEVDYSHLDTKAIPMERVDITNTVPCPSGAIAFHPHDPNTIYTVPFKLAYGGEFMKSTDSGKTWESLVDIFNGPSTLNVKPYGLIIDKNNPDNMYFALPEKVINDTVSKTDFSADRYGVYKSTDGGYTWKVSNKGITQTIAQVNNLAFSNDHKTIYAAVMREGGGLYKSTDEAETWQKVQLAPGVNTVNDVTITDSGRIVISAGFGTVDPTICDGGMWYSDDEGLTWTLGFPGRYIIDTTVDPKNENRMIVTMGGSSIVGGLNQGLYMTTDAGASWVKINNGIGNSNKTTEVLFDPVDPKIIWASSYASGFYKLILPDDFSSTNKTMDTEDYDISGLPIEALLK